MVSVYGYSDDNVEIDGTKTKYGEIGCYDSDVRIKFLDGTQIRLGYSKPNLAVWFIRIEKYGTAKFTLTTCTDENEEIYSDIFTINSDVKSVKILEKQKRSKR